MCDSQSASLHCQIKQRLTHVASKVVTTCKIKHNFSANCRPAGGGVCIIHLKYMYYFDIIKNKIKTTKLVFGFKKQQQTKKWNDNSYNIAS